MTSSLPTHHNQSPIDTCFVVVILHPTFTLQPNHISIDCSILHIFSASLPSEKTSKVAFASNYWNTTGSTFMCSHTSPAIILAFINAGDSSWLLVNSVLKITVLWQLFSIRIKGTLIVKRLTFLTIVISKLEMISNTNYNHLTWDTVDAPIQIDYTKQWHQLPIRIYYKSAKAAVQWQFTHVMPSSTWPVRCVLVSSTHTMMIPMVHGPLAPPIHNCSI